jgi:hypothetical protein
MDGLRLIEHCAEFLPQKDISKISDGIRGIYVLLSHKPSDPKKKNYEVVYIGMSRRGIKGRLEKHRRSASKSAQWSHFSVYSVWPNITDEEIEELEGLFRAIYRRDPRANKIAIQKSFGKLKKVQNNKLPWN